MLRNDKKILRTTSFPLAKSIYVLEKGFLTFINKNKENIPHVANLINRQLL